MKNNIFIDVKSEYEFLSRVEKSIADILLNSPEKFITYSMAELSKKALVSEGSIINFSKKFFCSGFSDLKSKVKFCISQKAEQPFSIIEKDQNIKSVMKLKIDETLSALHNTLEINNESSLKSSIDKILHSKKIEIYGVFHSGIVARDLCYQLIQLGIPATFVSDTLMFAVSASMLDENSLVIAISSSGKTREIIDAVKLAKNNNASVITITSDRFSPLAKISDNTLLTASSGLSISDRQDEIRLSQLVIIDTLCSYLRSVIDIDGQKHYYKLKSIISSHSIND